MRALGEKQLGRGAPDAARRASDDETFARVNRASAPGADRQRRMRRPRRKITPRFTPPRPVARTAASGEPGSPLASIKLFLAFADGNKS
jgi:hypothetical protein